MSFERSSDLNMKKISQLTPADPTLHGVSVPLVQSVRNRQQTALMSYTEEEDQKIYREFFRCYFPN